MLIFMQEPRLTSDNVAYNAVKVFDPEIDFEHIATVNKKQRDIINEGIDQINVEDAALKTCLKATGIKKNTTGMKGMFAKVLCLLPLVVTGIRDVVTLSVNRYEQMQKAVLITDSGDPDLILSCFSANEEDTFKTESWLDKIDEAAKAGKTVL